MNIFCIEHNYFQHKAQRQNENPGEPVIFIKPQSALLQAGASFVYPGFATELFCACELVLHIAADGKHIKEKFAANYYDSISAGVNFIALNTQRRSKETTLTWEEAKAWDNSSVAGHWIPAVNFKNKKDINFCLYKNKKLLQLGNSGLMINDFAAIIAGISKSFSINTGDLVFTGTPAGIGKLAPGDKLEAFIEDDSLLEFDIEQLL